MTSSPQGSERDAVLSWLVKAACASVAALAVLTAATDKFRPNFVVKTTYLTQTWPWAMLLGACLSISVAIFMMPEKSLAAVIAKLCTFDALALVVASAVCSHIIVTQSVPLIAAIASSQQIVLDRRTDGLIISGNWRCAQVLVVQGAELTPLCNPLL